MSIRDIPTRYHPDDIDSYTVTYDHTIPFLLGRWSMTAYTKSGKIVHSVHFATFQRLMYRKMRRDLKRWPKFKAFIIYPEELKQ